MNKTGCFLFFILLSVFHSAIADNWELFPFNQSSYYSDDGSTDFNHLYHYTQDSIRDDGALKTFFFNRFPYSLNHDQCIYESCKEWGDSTEFDSLSTNNNFYFFISGNDTAEIFQFAQQGDFWFIKCPNGSQGFDSIKLTCTFNDLAIVIGQTDSVKRFLIEAWNNGSVVNYFNNYEFELSKTFGLTKWFSFQFLLHQYNLFDARKYTLVGCEINGNKFGYSLPGFEDYFSCYQPGSIFKWTQNHKYNHSFRTDSIISVETSFDSIKIYAVRKFFYVDNTSFDTSEETSNNGTYVFYRKDYENVFTKTFSQIAFENNGLYPFGKKISVGNFCTKSTLNENGYFDEPLGCVNTYNLPNYTNYYALGAGIIARGISYPYSYDGDEYLLGYYCNGQGYCDWKSVIHSVNTIISTQFLISNLTSGILILNTVGDKTCLVYDDTGRLRIRKTSVNKIFDVSKLETGIYFIEAENEENLHEKIFKY